MAYTAQYVLFNDGEFEDVYALILKEHKDGSLDLFTPDDGEIHLQVPRREKKDYGSDGGGFTWHL